MGAEAAPAAEANSNRFKNFDQSGWFSRLTFGYVTPLISHGFRRKIDPEQLFDIPDDDRAARLVAADAEYCRSRAGPSGEPPHLRFRLLRTVRRDFCVGSCFKAIYVGQQLASPMVLRLLVGAVAQNSNIGVVWAVVLAIIQMIGARCEQAHQVCLFRAGRRARSLSTVLLFRKTSSLSTAALAGRDAGDVANLVSNDANRFFVFANQATLLWASPLQVVLAIWLLVEVLGPPALAGVAVLFAMVPILGHLSRQQATARRHHLRFTDERVRLVGEAARGMRGLKFAGWEREFLSRILAARRSEDDWVLRELLLFAWQISCTIVLPQMAAAVTFLAYAAPKNRGLAAKDAFAALTLFNTLRFPLMGLGEAVSSAVQVKVSVDRLQAILSIPEVVPSNPAEEASEGADADDGSYKAPRPATAAAAASAALPPADGAEPPAASCGNGAAEPALEITDGVFWWPVPLPEDKGEKKGDKKKKSKRNGRGSAASEKEGSKGRKIPPVKVDGEAALPDIVVANGAPEGGQGKGAAVTASAASEANGHPSHAGAAAAAASHAAAEPPKRGFVLSGLNLSVSAGEILAVIGPVGSGKSTLISGILADTCRSGTLTIRAPRGVPSEDLPLSPSAMDLEFLGQEKEKQSGGAGAGAAPGAGGAPAAKTLGRAPTMLACPGFAADEAWCGGVAYCGQNAWLLSGTLRENILFGRPWDERRYRAVISACCLWQDIAALPDLDRTVIGERGVTLSGGQKQRVNLARGAYGMPSLVLFDDVLSALDASTGRTVFARLLGESGLLRSSAVVLATHATQYLAHATRVCVLDHGRQALYGTHAEVLATAQEAAAKAEAAGADSDTDAGHNGGSALSPDVIAALTGVQEETGVDEEDGGDEAPAEEGAAKQPGGLAIHPAEQEGKLGGAKDGTLGVAEEQGVGAVSMATVGWYLSAMGGWFWVVMQLFLLTSERLTYLSTDYFLTTWTAAQHGPPDTVFGVMVGMPMSSGPGKFYGVTHAQFYGIGYGVCSCSNMVWFSIGGYRAAKAAFVAIATGVVKSPMSFFETTPTGRILNRLTYDVDVLDFVLVVTSLRLSSSVAWTITALTVMLGTVPPVAAVLAVVMAGYAWGVRRFSPPQAQLQRIDTNSRSPMQAHLAEALAGAPTIRAFGQRKRFIDRLDDLVDASMRASLAFTSAGRWFSVRLEAAGALVLLAVGLLCWGLRATVSPSLAGLALVWAVNFTISLTFFTQAITDFAAKIVSAERIAAYSHLPPEPPWDASEAHRPQLLALSSAPEAGGRERASLDSAEEGSVARKQKLGLGSLLSPPADWPARGEISFEKVVLRYRPELPPALKGLSFSVAAGERVGIVGRTGAGKSTVATALLRLREVDSGRILVDGVDISLLGLKDVRCRGICAIPQEPLLLSGTLRRNLDPFGERSDEEMWEALKGVRMAGQAAQGGQLPAGLDSPVADGGSNFSVGERQLLCFARALLRRPRILLLDEATASVDQASDDAIQQFLRTAFKGVSTLTIAHRLNTIMDYDSVLVLSSGCVIESGEPTDLLQEQPAGPAGGGAEAAEGAGAGRGAFATLVDSVGTGAAAHLRQMAVEAAEARRGRNATASCAAAAPTPGDAAAGEGPASSAAVAAADDGAD